MNELKHWFLKQSTSSKLLVSIAVFLTIALMVLEWVIEPWLQKVDSARLQVEDKIEIVAWMEKQANQNRNLIRSLQSKSNTKNVNKGSLITQIEQSAKRLKVYSQVERISPDKAGRVKVWINNGDFALLLKWIESLKGQSIDVVDLRVNQLEANNPVAMTVVFQSF